VLYTGQIISVSLSYVTVRREWKMERARGEQDALCTIASPLFLNLDWLATNMYIFNGQ
jgi:hypothetical protein